MNRKKLQTRGEMSAVHAGTRKWGKIIGAHSEAHSQNVASAGNKETPSQETVFSQVFKKSTKV